MKRYLLFIAVCMAAAVSCSPLKLVMNSRDKDGSRLVLTSDKHLFDNFDMALGAKVSPKDTVLAILITSTKRSDHGIFDTDDRLLLRLSDGSEVALNNIYHMEYEKESVTESGTRRVYDYGYVYSYDPLYDNVYVNPVEISKLVPEVHTRVTTNSYALYLIPRKQLVDIIEKGVIKLRVEYEMGEEDMPNTSSVSGTLRGMYECLKEGIDQKTNRKEF